MPRMTLALLRLARPLDASFSFFQIQPKTNLAEPEKGCGRGGRDRHRLPPGMRAGVSHEMKMNDGRGILLVNNHWPHSFDGSTETVTRWTVFSEDLVSIELLQAQVQDGTEFKSLPKESQEFVDLLADLNRSLKRDGMSALKNACAISMGYVLDVENAIIFDEVAEFDDVDSGFGQLPNPG